MNVANIFPVGDTTASRAARETGQSTMNKNFSDIFKDQMKDYRSNSNQEAHQKSSRQTERSQNDQYRTSESRKKQQYNDADRNENKLGEDGKEVSSEKKVDQAKDKTVDNKENKRAGAAETSKEQVETEAAESVKEEVELEELSVNEEAISDYIKELQMLIEVLKEKNLLNEEEAQSLSVEISKAADLQDIMKLLSNLLSKLENTTQLSQEDKGQILEAINLSNLSSEFKEKLLAAIEQPNKEQSDDKNGDAQVKAEVVQNSNKVSNINSNEKINTANKKESQDKVTAANIENIKEAKVQVEKGVGLQAEKKGTSEQNSFNTSSATNNQDGNILENLADIANKNMVTAKAALNQQPSAIDPRNVIDQVLQKVELLIRDGKSEINMQLSPENLGKLSIKVSVEQGTVTAKVYAETLQVKEIIETNLNVLKDALSEKGISVSSLEVQVGQDQEQLLQERSNFQQSGKRKKVNSAMNSPLMVDYDANNQYANPYLSISNFEGLA